MTRGVGYSGTRDPNIAGVSLSGVSGRGVVSLIEEVSSITAPDPAKTGTNITINGLTVTHNSTAAWNAALGTVGKSSGKNYFEIIVTASGGSGYEMAGVAQGTIDVNGGAGLDIANAYAFQSNAFQHRSTLTGGYGGTWGVGDVVGVGVDFTAGQMFYWLNGASQAATGTSAISGTYYPAIALYANSALTFRFAEASMLALPDGWTAWG